MNIIPALLLVLAASSCSIFTPRHAPYYRAGEPETPGYTPEGIVETKIYRCSVPGPDYRRMVVYLPADYYSTDKRYPVFYLFHGARGYETSWIRKADFFRTTDTLRRAGSIAESIIVMPNMNQYKDQDDYDDSRLKNALESIMQIDGTVESSFVDDVVAFVDSVYRTVPDKQHRAIAGNSIGAQQSMYISANHPDMFGYVGLFSLYPKVFLKKSAYNGLYRDFDRKFDTQFTDPPKVYFMSIGTKDFFYLHMQNVRKKMDLKRYRYDYLVEKTGHDWDIWADSYVLFSKEIFK